MRGYRAAKTSVALLATLDRAVVRLSGPGAVRAVNGLVTNSLEGLMDGAGCYAYMLDPKGRPIADMRVLPAPSVLGDSTEASAQVLWLDVAVDAVEGLTKHLARYVPPMFAVWDIADVRRTTILGPDSDACLRQLLESADLDDLGIDPTALAGGFDPETVAPLAAHRLSAHALVVRRESVEGPGFDLYVPEAHHPAVESSLGALVGALGGARAESRLWDTLRVERGIPAFGSEISSDRLAQEAGQDERAISFEKGCFTGQEVVARIHYRGHVNRRLRGLRVIGRPDALVSGGELARDGRGAGSIHTVVDSPAFGRIGLGYVRRGIEPGETLGTVADPGAEIEIGELPFTSS